MDELINHLEKRIKALIVQHDQLKTSNRELHQGQYLLDRKHEQLLKKQHSAIARIESLVSGLKEIEKLL